MFSLFVSFALSRSSHRRYFKREAEMLESNANGVGTCTTSAGVNIRSGPGTNYGKITAVPYKGTVTVTGSSGAWWKVTYGSTSGYAKAEYFSVPCKVSTSAGLNIRSGPGTGYSKITAMPNGASCTAIDLSNGWYKVQYGSTTGWASADYLTFGGSGSSGGGSTPSKPSGTVIRQGNSGFNSNIRKWGCAFMSSCWCGGVNSVSGCTSLYNTAVSKGWIRSDCYINNWASVATGLGKAKSYKWGSKSYKKASNEKEILWCKNSRTSSHFVVGNGNGGIEYDPSYDGSVSYSDCFEKRIFVY